MKIFEQVIERKDAGFCMLTGKPYSFDLVQPIHASADLWDNALDYFGVESIANHFEIGTKLRITVEKVEG